MNKFMSALLRSSAVAAILFGAAFSVASPALARDPDVAAADAAVKYCNALIDGEASLVYDADALKKLLAAPRACPTSGSIDDTIDYVNKLLFSKFDDPYVYVMSPKEAKALQEQFTGKHQAFEGGGIGLNLSFDPTKKLPADPNAQPIDPSDPNSPKPERLQFTGLIYHVVSGSPSDKAGFQDGDVVIKVNGVTVTGMDSEHVVNDLLRGPLDSKVKVTVMRGKHEITRTLKRERVLPDNVWARDLGNGIYSIVITDFERQNTAGEIIETVQALSKKARGFVLDLRGNPGGLLDEAIIAAGFFVQDGVIVSQRERVSGSDSANPQFHKITWTRKGQKLIVETKDDATGTVLETHELGLFTVKTDPKTGKPIGPRKPLDFSLATGGKPVVVIANGRSASAAEVFTGALSENHVEGQGKDKDQGATFMGVHTFGKFIGQTIVPTPSGAFLKATSFRYFSPRGEWLGDAYKHRTGLTPDVEVKDGPDMVPYTATDAQLNAAIDLIVKKTTKTKK